MIRGDFFFLSANACLRIFNASLEVFCYKFSSSLWLFLEGRIFISLSILILIFFFLLLLVYMDVACLFLCIWYITPPNGYKLSAHNKLYADRSKNPEGLTRFLNLKVPSSRVGRMAVGCWLECELSTTKLLV